MKQLMTLVAAAVLTLPLIGADYTSKGFCAKISRNGILKQVTYAGKEILRDSQIHGNYLNHGDHRDLVSGQGRPVHDGRTELGQ